MGSAALLLNRFITAVRRTCCRTVHRRDGSTALRAGFVLFRLVGRNFLVHHIFRLGSFRRGQGCFPGGRSPARCYRSSRYTYPPAAGFSSLPLARLSHQCAQLALCLEQLALLIYDRSLSLALFGQVQRSVLAFSAYSRPISLILLKSEIHKRHLSYYRPVYRGPCADVISIIAHRPLVCNERTAFLQFGAGLETIFFRIRPKFTR